MEKMTKAIFCIILLVISILSLLFIDFQEASVYLKFRNFDRESMSIKYDNNSDNLSEIVRTIQIIARKHNIVLAKTTIDNKKNNGVNVYLSLSTIEELNDLMKKNFKIKPVKNDKSEISFFSTYNQNSENQIGIINDIFGDHFYTYYLMDQMIEKNESLFGNYFIFYTDFQDYSNFTNEVNELLGYDTYSLTIYSSTQKYILALMIGCIAFLIIFYFIFQIYEYYNNSKKIGCMKLLGFDVKKINKNMIHKNMILYFVILFIVLMISIIFVKNISFRHILLLIGINLFIIIITNFISYICCIIIGKNYQIVSIIKMKNITLKISKISYKFKALMTIMLIIFSVIMSNNISKLYKQFKLYNDSKNLLDYGVFQSYVANQSESYDYEKLHALYLKIVDNMETVYAKFDHYAQYTETDFENIKKSEEEGKSFSYGSVDKNYLKLEKIKIYNLQGQEINIDDLNSICFLFPKSKKELIESFKEHHNESNDYYRQFNSEYNLEAYLYDDQKIDTYQVDFKYIDSPILRVIDNSLLYPYFYDGIGISFFGEGLETGLKIKLVNDNKEETLKILNSYIDELNLSNIFSSKSFIVYRDYFNDEILESHFVIMLLGLAIIFIFIVYVVISLQLLKLYIESQRKKVLVKKLMGFENNVIFESVYKKNLYNTIISIIISLLILIIIKKFNVYFFIIMFVFLTLDFIITLLSIRSTKLSAIYLDLKGGYHD